MIAVRRALTGGEVIGKKGQNNKMDTEDDPSAGKERFCFVKQTWKLEKPPEGAVLLPPSALCKRKETLLLLVLLHMMSYEGVRNHTYSHPWILQVRSDKQRIRKIEHRKKLCESIKLIITFLRVFVFYSASCIHEHNYTRGTINMVKL